MLPFPLRFPLSFVWCLPLITLPYLYYSAGQMKCDSTICVFTSIKLAVFLHLLEKNIDFVSKMSLSADTNWNWA